MNNDHFEIATGFESQEHGEFLDEPSEALQREFDYTVRMLQEA